MMKKLFLLLLLVVCYVKTFLAGSISTQGAVGQDCDFVRMGGRGGFIRGRTQQILYFENNTKDRIYIRVAYGRYAPVTSAGTLPSNFDGVILEPKGNPGSVVRLDTKYRAPVRLTGHGLDDNNERAGGNIIRRDGQINWPVSAWLVEKRNDGDYSLNVIPHADQIESVRDRCYAIAYAWDLYTAQVNAIKERQEGLRQRVDELLQRRGALEKQGPRIGFGPTYSSRRAQLNRAIAERENELITLETDIRNLGNKFGEIQRKIEQERSEKKSAGQ